MSLLRLLLWNRVYFLIPAVGFRLVMRPLSVPAFTSKTAITSDSLPEASELSACTEFELTAKGGHVGFVDGSLKRPGYYLERRIPQWLASGA